MEKERELDDEKWQSLALFLPADTVASASGQLSARTISAVWAEVCALANIKGKTQSRWF